MNNNGGQMREHTCHPRNGRTDLSAVAEPAFMESYEIDWTIAKVIDTAANTRTQKVEALHIARKAPSLNKESGISLSASSYASGIG